MIGDVLKQNIEEIERTAKSIGYKSKREVEAFVKGWVAGYCRLLADKVPKKVKRK